MFPRNILEYAETEATLINEVQRVLRPGGKLILSVPLFDGSKYASGLYADRLIVGKNYEVKKMLLVK